MRNRGFTLIELMIVVAILGILISIAVSVFRNKDEIRARQSNRSDVIVFDNPDLSKCEFLGLNPQDKNVYRCADGKIYTSQ